MERKRCEGCVYWQKLAWSGNSRGACHFLLEEDRCRRRDGEGRCLEYKNFLKPLDKEKKGETLNSDQSS